VKGFWICDSVIPGSRDNPMQWIESIKPEIVCLWYDQRGPFVDALEWEIIKLWLTTKIIRIDSLKPEIFKSSLLKKKSS
jgi:glycerol-3-phosphate cytidylyltransferase-like family protein